MIPSRPPHTPITLTRPAPSVTYADFATLARRRGWTAAFLANHFRGKIEEPRAFFERVLACRSNGEDLSGSVIPFRSVLEFYHWSEP